MPSTFANRDTNWYIRTGGNELNGGGFDPYVSGAGTNYADQDSPQISSTTGTCTVGSTTWTDTGVTFTSAMVGNVIRISAATGGTATALDYFVVTGYTDANNITLDRSPCAGTNITAATYRLGGAHAHIKNYMSSSGSGTNNPALSTPLIGGNTIYIRGSGSDDPSSSDYDWSNDYWIGPAGGNQSNGNFKVIGYNGRPRISHRGLLVFTGGFYWVKNISFFMSNGTWIDKAVFNAPTNSYYNCIFNANGYDCWVTQFGDGSNASGQMLCCEIRNTGGGAVGTTKAGVQLNHGGALIYGTWIHDLRANAVTTVGTYGSVVNCLITDNLGDGFRDTQGGGSSPIPLVFMNNTVDANGGHGISLAANAIGCHTIVNNIISNHVGASKYAINFTDTYKVNQQKYRYVVGFNNYYGNTTNFNTVSSVVAWTVNPGEDGVLVGDLAVDPQYTNAAGNDFTPGNNVKSVGFHSYDFGTTAYTINMGGVFT